MVTVQNQQSIALCSETIWCLHRLKYNLENGCPFFCSTGAAPHDCDVQAGSQEVMWRWSNEQAQQRSLLLLRRAHTRHRAVTELQTLEPPLYHSVIFSALSQSEWSEERSNDVPGHSEALFSLRVLDWLEMGQFCEDKLWWGQSLSLKEVYVVKLIDKHEKRSVK